MLDVILGTISPMSSPGMGCGTADRYCRIRNKAKLKPIDLVDPRNTDLMKMLQNAELTIGAMDDVVVEDDDDKSNGAGSESD